MNMEFLMKDDKINKDKQRFPITLPSLLLILLILSIIVFLSLMITRVVYGKVGVFGYLISLNEIVYLMAIFSLVFSLGLLISIAVPGRLKKKSKLKLSFFTDFFFNMLRRPKKKAEEAIKVKEVTEKPLEEEIEHHETESLPFIEIYPIEEPYVYAGIIRIENKIAYHVIEPKLTEEEERWRKMIDEKLYYELSLGKESFKSREEASKYLSNKIDEIIKRYRWKISETSLDKIKYYIVRDKLGYGKIDPLMKDENIEDISCNGPGQPVYVWHRFYESISTNIVFEDDEELDNFVIRLAYLAGRHVSISTPIVDATLPDGTRINITFRREVSRRGTTFTVRKFRREPFTIIDLINFRTLDIELAAFLWYVVENMASILVAGGTATGKTTLLNALSLFIRPEKKIVSIEDTPELQLYHENWNSLVERTGFGIRGGEAEIRMFELLKTALRQRPDIIIVGEVRGEEAYTMFQAMATGHGALGSIHAESPEAVISRLTSEPMNVPESLILTLDLILLISRVKIGDRIYRKVLSISEPIWDPKENRIRIETVYEYDAYRDIYVFSKKSNTLDKMSKRYGIDMEVVMGDIERRKTIIEWMVKKNIRDYKSFIDTVKKYYLNPDEVYDVARFELMEMEAT